MGLVSVTVKKALYRPQLVWKLATRDETIIQTIKSKIAVVIDGRIVSLFIDATAHRPFGWRDVAVSENGTTSVPRTEINHMNPSMA